MPDFDAFDLPAGQACDFGLSLGGIEDKRAIKDLNNGVHIEAGNGWDLTFTNLSNQNSITLPSNGSVMKTTLNADGDSQTVVATGNNVVILFPTDTPTGPSTTLYTGRIVYNDTLPDHTFTVLSTSGQTTDICALLA
jgi:hypothetical protein